MNYISELNGFRNWTVINCPSTGVVALWYTLISVANVTGWKEWFTVPNTTLGLLTGLSRQGLDWCRNWLIQKGRIEYRKGGRNQAGSYRLISFECQNLGTELGTELGTGPAFDLSLNGRSTGTLFKLNKTIRDQRSSSQPDGATANSTNKIQSPDSGQKVAAGKKKKIGSDPKIFLETTPEYVLASLLRQEILKNLPEARMPGESPGELAIWCLHIERMIRIDHRTPDDIARAIQWCQHDSFWRANILSPKKLREKWETLILASKRKGERGNGVSDSTGATSSGDHRGSKYPMRVYASDQDPGG